VLVDGHRAAVRLVIVAEIPERLPVGVADGEAGVGFLERSRAAERGAILKKGGRSD